MQNRSSGRKSWPISQLQIKFKYHTHTFNLERKQQVPFGVDVASELAHSDPLHLLGWGYDLFHLFDAHLVRSEVDFVHAKRHRLVIVCISNDVW